MCTVVQYCFIFASTHRGEDEDLEGLRSILLGDLNKDTVQVLRLWLPMLLRLRLSFRHRRGRTTIEYLPVEMLAEVINF